MLATKLFWVSGVLGFYGLFGWVHLGMVHWCLTTNTIEGKNCKPSLAPNTSLNFNDALCRNVYPPPSLRKHGLVKARGGR